MKKTFLARRNALLSSENLSWGAFALAFAVLVLFVRLLAPDFFWRTLTPVFRGADTLTVASRTIFSGFGNTAALSARNAELASENAALANENQTLMQKAASLSALFGSSAPRSDASIIAGVVARPPASPYDTLVLALGADAGIAPGMEAFGEGGVPLGIVSSVLPGFSRVTLLSSPGMRIGGWVGHAHLPLSIFGSGAGTLGATVPRAAGIAIGDAVFAPGPGALPIGNVVRIDSDPSSPSVTLQIQPAINFFSITWVALRATGPTFAAGLFQATSTGL